MVSSYWTNLQRRKVVILKQLLHTFLHITLEPLNHLQLNYSRWKSVIKSFKNFQNHHEFVWQKVFLGKSFTFLVETKNFPLKILWKCTPERASLSHFNLDISSLPITEKMYSMIHMCQTKMKQDIIKYYHTRHGYVGKPEIKPFNISRPVPPTTWIFFYNFTLLFTI